MKENKKIRIYVDLDNTITDFMSGVRSFSPEVQAKYGIDENVFLEKLDDMVEQAFDDQCTGANPRYPLMSEIRQMYLNAYYGR